MLSPRGIALGASKPRLATGYEGCAKFIFLLRVVKVPNRFLIQGKLGQLCLHDFLLE